LTSCLFGQCSSDLSLAPGVLLLIVSVFSMTLIIRGLVAAYERSAGL
jgi:hypothetical protein